MPKIDPENVIVSVGTTYPSPFDEPCKTRVTRRLSTAGGLTQFGVNHVTVPPGTWASQRHWHSAEDEFVYILAGHPTLIDNDGETELSPGDYAAHPAGEANGHHLVNRTDEDVVFLVMGTRTPEIDSGHYPDIDLSIPANGTPTRKWCRKDGTPY